MEVQVDKRHRMVNNLWERKSKEKHVKQESVDSGDISSNNKDIDREEERRHWQKKPSHFRVRCFRKAWPLFKVVIR